MSHSSFKDRALRELELMHPSRVKLITILKPLSPHLNPFAKDGVIMRPALMYSAEGGSNKLAPAWGMIRNGVLDGTITEGTKLFLASSGQTAGRCATICKRLGIEFTAIMRSDTPSQKVNAVSVYGFPIDVHLTSFPTIARARELSSGVDGRYIDQYDDPANAQSQRLFMAPHLWPSRKWRNDVIFSPAGTLGTPLGVKHYTESKGYPTRVNIVVCADDEEIPAARTEKSIREEVRNGSPDDFPEMLKVGRYSAFVASAALLGELCWTMPGPTSGMTFAGSLLSFQKHKRNGTLDSLRGPDGKIRCVFLCPDGMEWYLDVVKTALHGERDFGARRISGQRILDLLS